MAAVMECVTHSKSRCFLKKKQSLQPNDELKIADILTWKWGTQFWGKKWSEEEDPPSNWPQIPTFHVPAHSAWVWDVRTVGS